MFQRFKTLLGQVPPLFALQLPGLLRLTLCILVAIQNHSEFLFWFSVIGLLVNSFIVALCQHIMRLITSSILKYGLMLHQQKLVLFIVSVLMTVSAGVGLFLGSKFDWAIGLALFSHLAEWVQMILKSYQLAIGNIRYQSLMQAAGLIVFGLALWTLQLSAGSQLCIAFWLSALPHFGLMAIQNQGFSFFTIQECNQTWLLFKQALPCAFVLFLDCSIFLTMLLKARMINELVPHLVLVNISTYLYNLGVMSSGIISQEISQSLSVNDQQSARQWSAWTVPYMLIVLAPFHFLFLYFKIQIISIFDLNQACFQKVIELLPLAVLFSMLADSMQAALTGIIRTTSKAFEPLLLLFFLNLGGCCLQLMSESLWQIWLYQGVASSVMLLGVGWMASQVDWQEECRGIHQKCQSQQNTLQMSLLS